MPRRPTPKLDREARPTVLDASRFSPANRERLSGPGLRAFLRIADLWRLSEAERLRVLGLPGRSTYHAWVAKAQAGKAITLPVDVLLRISAILGIHKGLRILFEREESGIAWLKGPHDSPVFGGQPPMALVVSGTQDGLMLVRRYLDAWRGGVFAGPNAADADFKPYTDQDIVVI